MTSLKSALWGLLSTLLIAVPLTTNASISLDPTKIVFDGRIRSEVVSVINQTDQQRTYRVTLENKRLSPEGKFQSSDLMGIDNEFADSIIRYSPRQFTLKPKQVQTVRLLLRKPANLNDGEYLTFFKVAEVLDQQQSNIENLNSDAEGVSVRLIANYSISIPVHVVHGDASATVNIANSEWLDNDKLRVKIERQGNRSVRGQLIARLNSGEIVARLNNATLYYPNPFQQYTLQVEYPSPLARRDLILEYRPDGQEEPVSTYHTP